MTTPSSSGKPSSGKSVLGAGLLAVAACAVCCAGPLLAVLGSVGAASVIGAIWAPVLAVLAVAAVVAAVWVHRRRKRASACQTGPATVDVGMPTRIPPGTGSDRLPR
ncbi:hypothetical protein OH809_11555 [Streptomyces sp. NBC_00873]|uniref:hypothetical protein n=1 Tax=unclassified Streptomyces TaxID=2593676 RepID=UPI00386F2133|nr:hypothetical protein OH809_11555 [Streptomyces sp. NBC_00873]WTA46720.1 hypothetical protein OH821_32250 [Streptomyces sp. NBC_00842]